MSFASAPLSDRGNGFGVTSGQTRGDTRIAIVFFGVARALTETIESIVTNIYECNRGRGFDLHIIASLNIVNLINNRRSKELNVPIDPRDALILAADTYILSRQNESAISDLLAMAQAQPDVFDDDWVSVQNLLHQLLSLKRAWSARGAYSDTEFDYYLFVRPDLKYMNEIRLEDLVRQLESDGDNEGAILVPDWNSWGGFNDRFAFANAAAAFHYAGRIALVPEYCRRHSLYSEAFLAYALDQGNCRVGCLAATANRVRANHVVWKEDFGLSVTKLPTKPESFSFKSGHVVFPLQGSKAMADRAYGTSEGSLMVRAEGEYPVSEASPGAEALRLQRVYVGDAPRVSPLSGLNYLDYLKRLHVRRQVGRYLEIGTQTGQSLRLALGRAVAIDPSFRLEKDQWKARHGFEFFEMTSDMFFESNDPTDSLEGTIDLAFIDGMHLSEYVLRDFLNVERYCNRDSIIVLHDAIPQNFEMTERVRNTKTRRDRGLAEAWTGDVWRVVPMLRRERPDLHIQVLDCPPTGLVIISHLDPGYRCPPDRLRALIAELTASEPTEPEFWSFIEALSVSDSRQMPAQPTARAAG